MVALVLPAFLLISVIYTVSPTIYDANGPKNQKNLDCYKCDGNYLSVCNDPVVKEDITQVTCNGSAEEGWYCIKAKTYDVVVRDCSFVTDEICEHWDNVSDDMSCKLCNTTLCNSAAELRPDVFYFFITAVAVLYTQR